MERQKIHTIEAEAGPRSFAAAPLDEYAQRITNGLAYMGGLLVLPLFFAYLANLRWEGLLIPVALALALAIALLLMYGGQPKRYELTDEALLVHRRLWRPLRVPLDVITGVSLATPLSDVPLRRVRFAFNAGIFGYQGPFRLAPYGEVFFLATNRARLVAVARDQRTPLIISPERPRELMEALNQLRGRVAMERLTGGLEARPARHDEASRPAPVQTRK